MGHEGGFQSGNVVGAVTDTLHTAITRGLSKAPKPPCREPGTWMMAV
jgi:hypothetical protein